MTWPPQAVVRNIKAGLRMRDLKTTTKNKIWDKSEDEDETIPAAQARVQFVTQISEERVWNELVNARDTGNPISKSDLYKICRLSEGVARQTLNKLIDEKKAVKCAKSGKLANNKRCDLWRAAHIGEDHQLLTETSEPNIPLRKKITPYLIDARDSGIGISKKELASKTNLSRHSVANTLIRMEDKGLVKKIGRSHFRESSSNSGTCPFLYAATERLT